MSKNKNNKSFMSFVPQNSNKFRATECNKKGTPSGRNSINHIGHTDTMKRMLC